MNSIFVQLRSFLLVLLIVVSAHASVLAQRQTDLASDAPPSRTQYMGRRIATTMHYRGAPWLIRDSREREERCSLMLANLGVQPGMTVCDIGCGNGFYSLQLAEMVGPTGRVLAVDIQPEMLELLQERAAKTNLENITSIVGTLHDPNLPQAEVDLILLVDVYHEFSHPQWMLKAMRRALAPAGVIALLEYRKEDPNVPIKPLHKMSKRQIMKEFSANGLRLVKQYDRLPWQHMMFFGRDETHPVQPQDEGEPAVSSEGSSEG